MAGSSKQSDSSMKVLEKENDVMVSIDEYESDEPVYRDFEKHITNLNVHMASLTQQHEELTRSHQEFSANFMVQHELIGQQVDNEQHAGLKRSHEEFSANFIKQQDVLLEEFVKIRGELFKLRKSMGN